MKQTNITSFEELLNYIETSEVSIPDIHKICLETLDHRILFYYDKNELIKYDNVDGGDSFRYSLGNRDKIKYFVLSVYNQDGVTIPDMPDYFIHIQFIIRKKDETKLILNKVLEYNKENNSK
jgi:hypothetical protein